MTKTDNSPKVNPNHPPRATGPDNATGMEYWFAHRVSYGETDAMGVLYYAEYLHIFERARSAFIRHLGTSYREVEARGMMLPVREAGCRYRAPARFDDLLQVHLYIGELGRASLTFHYTVYSEDRKIIMTTGFTQHACVNPQGRPLAMPQWFRDICLGVGLE